MTNEEKSSDIYDICLEKKSLYCIRKMGEETCEKCKTYKMYKLGLAEGRKELEQWKQEWQDAQIQANEEGFARTTIQIKYKELEKENAELKEQNKDLCETLDIMNNRESELFDQIEKMKRCGNCSNFNSGNCKFTLKRKGDVTTFVKMHEDFFCINYDKWELAE